MTFRLDHLLRDLATKASEHVSSLRRQAPAANMIGKFAVDHLSHKIRGGHGAQGTTATPETTPPEDDPTP